MSKRPQEDVGDLYDETDKFMSDLNKVIGIDFQPNPYMGKQTGVLNVAGTVISITSSSAKYTPGEVNKKTAEIQVTKAGESLNIVIVTDFAGGLRSTASETTNAKTDMQNESLIKISAPFVPKGDKTAEPHRDTIKTANELPVICRYVHDQRVLTPFTTKKYPNDIAVGDYVEVLGYTPQPKVNRNKKKESVATAFSMASGVRIISKCKTPVTCLSRDFFDTLHVLMKKNIHPPFMPVNVIEGAPCGLDQWDQYGTFIAQTFVDKQEDIPQTRESYSIHKVNTVDNVNEPIDNLIIKSDDAGVKSTQLNLEIFGREYIPMAKLVGREYLAQNDKYAKDEKLANEIIPVDFAITVTMFQGSLASVLGPYKAEALADVYRIAKPMLKMYIGGYSKLASAGMSSYGINSVVNSNKYTLSIVEKFTISNMYQVVTGHGIAITAKTFKAIRKVVIDDKKTYKSFLEKKEMKLTTKAREEHEAKNNSNGLYPSVRYLNEQSQMGLEEEHIVVAFMNPIARNKVIDKLKELCPDDIDVKERDAKSDDENKYKTIYLPNGYTDAYLAAMHSIFTTAEVVGKDTFVHWYHVAAPDSDPPKRVQATCPTKEEYTEHEKKLAAIFADVKKTENALLERIK
jgi:hypothetical protein